MVTCDDYKDVYDKSFCLDKPDLTYPVNDDYHSLYYDCTNGKTFCGSCDVLQNAVSGIVLPLYVYVEDAKGYCDYDGQGPNPTPGFPINHIFD